MIDIQTTKVTDESELKDLPKIKKVNGIVIHCVPALFTYEEKEVFTKDIHQMSLDQKFCSKQGYHFIIDAKYVVNCVPDDIQTTHTTGDKQTFISRAIYNNKPNESSVSVLMMLPKDQDYKDIEKKTIKFIADYLIEKELSPDSIMRGFDLTKMASPLHLLDKIKWRGFMELLSTTYKAMKDKTYKDEDLEKVEPTYTNEEIREFYLKNGQTADKYAKDLEPDHRDIKAIVDFKSTEATDIKSFTSENKTTFSYSIAENIPASVDHCSRAFDTLAGKATPNNLDVEPIYPDLAVPPGGTVTLLNSVTKDTPVQSNDVPLSVEEFQNRERAFNVKNYKDAKKTVTGKPVNNNDPYPADDKIKELESHIPKVKIDEVAFKLHDCNHPGSVIGLEVAKNFAMVQDEIITMAKRTERRLVKIENVISTLTRNLFRTASRMQINCVYYGGQDVYGKYKCIRCLHNDRISDGQSMTLDQCLCCTRYEPILGQVYAILDDTGTNVAQVLDDVQMSYMSMEEYADLTRTEEMHTERKMADMLFKNEIVPEPFSKIFPEGFKMNWNPTQLETQRPNIAKYETEGIKAVKPVIKKKNEGEIKPEFKDAVEPTEAYETLKYDSNNYSFEGFGDDAGLVSIDASSIGGAGATEIRSKIVKYAENAVKLCQDGKAGYSQDQNLRCGGKDSNGITYWDCSGLAQESYKAAGINSIQGNTYTEYPKCLPSTGGIIIPIADESKALPGDLVWFTGQSPKPGTIAELEAADVDAIGHVGVYAGNGEYLNASTSKGPLNQQVKKSTTKAWDKRIFAFGRPKELVEADKKAAELSAGGEGFFDYASHSYNSTITALATKECAGQVNATIKSLQQYRYKQALIESCAKHKIDPYMMLGLIATESSGDPTCRTGGYWGLMQTESGSTKATGNLADIKCDIENGCQHFNTIKGYLKAPRGQNLVLAVHAYNAGNGTVDDGCNKFGAGAETAKGGAIAQPIADAAVRRFGAYKQNEVTSYVAKVILRANALRAKKALG